MSVRNLAIHSLQTAYGQVQRTGILESPFVEPWFVRAYFLYKRYIEDSLAALLRSYPRLIGAGDILDIGANVGYTAHLFAPVLKEGGRVYAFEPDPKNFAMLERTVSNYGLTKQVTCLQMAVGDKCGSVELLLNPEHMADHRVVTKEFERVISNEAKKIAVPITSVDAFVEGCSPKPSIAFIKIDVQGYEPGVLAGMQATLAANPNAPVLFEHSPEGSLEMGFGAFDVPDYFVQRGYSLFSVLHSGELKMVSADSNPLPSTGYLDVLAIRNPSTYLLK